MKGEKGAQTRKATGQLETIDGDEQLLYCCSCVVPHWLPPNWWEEVWSGCVIMAHTERSGELQ